MITYSKLGGPHRGNLGNQLFQIASTIGLADQFGHEYTFPAWKYSKYFAKPLPTGGRFEAYTAPESSFTYNTDHITREQSHDVDGWRQSERYWEQCPEKIKETFRFEEAFQAKTLKRFEEAFLKPVIAISVRRGDFVGNQNYAQIPPRYYLTGLFLGIPDWTEYNVLLFSDDMDYCRVHFEGVPGVYFADGTDIEQLCLMTHCRHFIISNSTFSWWGAWLGEKEGSKVIRPPKNFAGELARQNSEEDFWPTRWTINTFRKLPLQDMTFLIPVFIDHMHRSQNLNLSVAILLENFDTNLIVGEQGFHKAAHMASRGKYHHFTGMNVMHRTKMLNDMAKMATTDIVANWDADVFVPAAQIWIATERIRAGQDMVYPFDGRFARVPRKWFDQLNKTQDIGIFGATEFTGKHGKPLPTTSVGGAIFFNRLEYLNGGGENEYMVSFGPEDWERNFRFKALGYTVTRVDGSLYHLDHWCGPNSSSRNPFFKQNHDERDKMRAMKADDLVDYVAGWPWRP